MHVPKHFWADVVSTTCFLINRMPLSVLNWDTPYHILFPNKPLFPIEPQIFGCTCFVRDIRPQVSKLDHKSLKCIFLGYSQVQKGYRCYYSSLRKYLVSTNVKFFENVPFSLPPTHTSQGEADDLLVYTIASPVAPPVPAPVKSAPPVPTPVKPPINQVYTRRQNPPVSGPTPAASTSDPVPVDDLPIALRKDRRQCVHLISSFCTYNHLSSQSCSFIASLDSISLPNTFQEALSHPGWRSAMIEEMDALNGNGTWNLVHLPTGKKAIGCCGVFAVKVNPDGSIARLKARLVVKGYAQTYGVDYSDTFSPVAKMTYVRLFISLPATHNWDLHQLDIKNAFLDGDLQEEVYMEQSPGFVAQGEIGKVCRLWKSLYGLKQSPRAWFGKFSQAVEKFGLQKSKSDHSVFYRNSSSGIILLVVYVDDIVITESDSTGISSLKSFLHGQFHTKDLGMLRYFLGVKVMRSKHEIFLSQRSYVLDLLSETRKLGAKSCSSSMALGVHLTREGELFEDPERYRRLDGKLNYLTVTRPDIAHSVSVISQYMSSPIVDNWAAVEHILCYFKGASERGILYSNHGHKRVKYFTDADWAGSKEDRRSTSSYCVFVSENLVSWKSKKQEVVSRSTAESEYRAMTRSLCEIMWFHQLLMEVGIKTVVPAKLSCDNQAALHIASNPIFHERTKHIEIDYHFVREKIQLGLISTGYVKTGEQLGDIFTKALSGDQVSYLCNKLGMINIYAPT